MFELMRTNDPVLISWLKSNFADVGIDVLVLDEHMSIMDGSVMAIPRRIIVPEAQKEEAQAILAEVEGLRTTDHLSTAPDENFEGLVFAPPALKKT